MSFQNVGNTNGGIFTLPGTKMGAGSPLTMDAAGIASGGAFLISELEKRDAMIREPLTSVTYPRDVPIDVGGGWVDFVSAMSVAYGLTNGAQNSPVHAGGANNVPVVQASLDKGLFKAHTFAAALRVMFVDMAKSNFIGRSLDQLLSQGVRLAYDKHMDANTYVGMEEYGTTGLINNPDAVESTAASNGATTPSTKWADKTPDQILADINAAITAAWAAAEYDEAGYPNHVLLPYEQYTYILNTKVTDLATETILDFVMKNNIATKNGRGFFIGGVRWLKGAGTGGTDRMVVYNNDRRFVKMDELVPLSRVMTSPNAAEVCYDTAYMANISEVQLFYPQTIRYIDGI